MTLTDIFAAINDPLRAWCEAHNARLSIAKDPWHAYELIAAGPSGLIVVLGLDGERLKDSPRTNPLAMVRVEVSIGNGMGLTADPGAAQFKQVGDRAALIDLIDDLINAVAGITLPDPVSLPNTLRLAAYRATFHITRLVRKPAQ